MTTHQPHDQDETGKRHFHLLTIAKQDGIGSIKYSNVTLSTGTRYIIRKDLEEFYHEGSVIMSVSYLGRMTEEEYGWDKNQ
jgi:hypothetical protein